MNEAEARSVLGVSRTATLDEARKAHRRLVKVFHPDRNSGTQEESAKATAATARINQAWDTLRDLAARQLLGNFLDEPSTSTGSARDFRLHPRPPGPSECLICGCSPAEPATFRFVQTFLIWLSTGTLTGSFCRACGLEVFRDCQSRTLTRGWWGIGIFALPFFAVANVLARRSVINQGGPSYRDINVVTPADQPLLPGKPVFRRPSVLTVTTLVLAVVAFSSFSIVSTESRKNSASDLDRASTASQSSPTSEPGETAIAPPPNPTSAEPLLPTDPNGLSETERREITATWTAGAEQAGFTDRQANCIGSALRSFSDDELLQLMDSTIPGDLKRRMEVIADSCSRPTITDCFKRSDGAFRSVTCGSREAEWQVVGIEQAFALWSTPCIGRESFQYGSKVFCLERVR